MTTDKSGRTSAGILLWRSREGRVEVLLAHQGGPFWVKKDLGHWTIPKGEVEPGEELVSVARREFAEETGHEVPDQLLIDLGEITQKSGKLVLGWAVEGDLDPSTAVSNTYDVEWPPHSGCWQLLVNAGSSPHRGLPVPGCNQAHRNPPEAPPSASSTESKCIALRDQAC